MILSGMITWWKEQMRDLVPASLRSSLGRSWRPELVAAAETADPSDITLFLRTRGGETALGRHELTGTGLRDAVARLPRAQRKAAVLRTPPDLLLEQQIVLPLTAEPDLKRVVAYRWTA